MDVHPSRFIEKYQTSEFFMEPNNETKKVSWGFHMFSHVLTCFRMFSHVFTCFHMFSHVFTCFHMFSHVFTCFHMFSHVFTVFEIWENYSELMGWFRGY